MRSRDRWALIAMVVGYGVLDTGTTIISELQGGYETNPTARWFMHQFGMIPGAILNKTLVLGAILLLVVGHWRVCTRLEHKPTHATLAIRYAIPVGVTAVGLALAVNNTLVILTT